LVHIICGLAALTANIVGIMFGANIPLAAGVWSSIFFVSSGLLALAGACIKTKRLVVSTLVTIRNTILMFLNDPDPQHQFARVIKVTN